MTSSAVSSLESLADDNEVLGLLSRRVNRLYSLPSAALRIVQLASTADVPSQELKQALQTDPALAAKVLAVVNSSLFGLREKVLDLQHAVNLLGLKALRLLVLGLSLPRDLLSGMEVEILSRYWRLSLAKSVAAKEISRRHCQRRHEDEVFLAALLQDIGMLALIQQLQQPYVSLLKHGHTHRADILELESQSLGFDHTTLSLFLLRSWGLPERIIHLAGLPLRSGHQVAAADREPASILRVADLIGQVMIGHTEMWKELVETARRRLGLERPALELLLHEIEEHLRSLADAIGVETQHWPELKSLLEESHSALAHAAEDVVRDWMRTSSPTRWLDVLQANEIPAGGGSRETAEFFPALGAHAAADLDSRARLAIGTDRHPLSDGALLSRIATSAEACRRMRCPLSLILCEIDHFDDLVLRQGVDRSQRLIQFVYQTVVECSGGIESHTSIRDARFTIVLEHCDRGNALRVARNLSDRISRDAARATGVCTGVPISLSIGVATITVTPRNFAPEDLLAASCRCLSAAQTSGGGMTKSIDLM